jgi:protein-S-isoprenylcysteine O-methyltransferase Ste14
MLVSDRISNQGQFLFRWRSFLPLLLLPLALAAVLESGATLQLTMGKAFEDAWEAFSIIVSLVGVAVRVATVGFVPARTSGRNTRRQIAASLNTTGLYSVVRNPLYLGNFLIMLGVVMDLQVWWFVLLASVAFWTYYERIVCAEEIFLLRRFGREYAEWARRTPALIPNLRLWRRPELRFSLRTVLRREYGLAFFVTLAFAVIEVGHDVLLGEATRNLWPPEWKCWFIVLAATGLIALTLRTLKKRSHYLRIAGR